MFSSTLRLVEWSPTDSNLFTHYNASSSRLDLYEVNEAEKDVVCVKSRGELNNLTCMEMQPCSQTGRLAYGNLNGVVTLMDWQQSSEDVVSEVAINTPAKTGKRSCSSVSWNKIFPSQLAAGFELQKNEFCVVLWDVEHQSQSQSQSQEREEEDKASSKLCFDEATASLCWLPLEPHVLAVGTSMGWVRVYDTRVGGNPAAEISLMAHPAPRPRKVKGIRPDPFHSHLLATFSDSAGESVKMWDLRKGAAAKSKLTPSFTIFPHSSPDADGQFNQQSAVVDVAWSIARSNVLAVATTHSKNISFYCTSKTPPEVTTRVPIHIIALPEQVRCFSWQNTVKVVEEEQARKRAKEVAMTVEQNESTFVLNRLLVATNTSFAHFEVIEAIPLAFAASGLIAGGVSNKICVSKQSTETTSFNELDCWRITEQTIRERSSAGYSLDAGKNLQVLSDELDALFSASDDGAMSSASALRVRCLLELSRVWSWVDRVESLHDDALSLTNCGVLSLFLSQEGQSGSKREQHSVLVAQTFTSSFRDSARLICGWTTSEVSTNSAAATTTTSSHGTSTASSANKQRTKVHSPDQIKKIDGSSRLESGNEEDGEEGMDFNELEEIIDECEDNDSFERAAALALWHGDLDLAVRVLQRNIDAGVPDTPLHTQQLETDNDRPGGEQTIVTCWDTQVTAEYLKLMSLVAMCFAGYNGQRSQSAAKDASSDMWASMCLHVLEQLEGSRRQAINYLKAACLFLLETVSVEPLRRPDGDEDGQRFDCVVMNDVLALEDRIAFACVYLSDDELKEWLIEICESSKARGSCEGLLVTGLSEDGLDILQQYIDQCDDIQTAALLVGRSVDKQVSRSWLWLYEYRNLLNRWQLFIERASLDVELGKRQRQLKVKAPGDEAGSVESSGSVANAPNTSLAVSAALTASATATDPASSISSAFPSSSYRGAVKSSAALGSLSKSRLPSQFDKKNLGNARLTYALPSHSDFPHIYLRCHYCSSALPVDAMQQHQHTAFLRKQRPIINFCPNCKKPLPRCYVCQLYMGLVNPHTEVNRMLAQKRMSSDKFMGIKRGIAGGEGGKGGALAVEGEVGGADVQKAEHNVLDFGRWLFFCQRCKHGGHASCIQDWFEGGEFTSDAKRDVCGVNGCTCRCR